MRKVLNMISKRSFCFTLSLTLLLSFSFLSADEPVDTIDKKVSSLKCFIMKTRPVAGKKIVEYKDAKLYVCCSACVARVKKYPEKYEGKANHQLVYTGQYKQTLCPITGSELTDDSPKFKVDGGVLGAVEVHVASAKEVASLKAMEIDDQINALFGTAAFKKGKFVKVKKDKKG